MIERREGRSKLVYNKETKRLETVWPGPTHTPTPPPQADREAVREAVTAMKFAVSWSYGEGHARLLAAIAKLGEE